MNFDEQELFKGKSFSSLLKDIYTTTKNKEKQINILISELKPLVKNIQDISYQDIAVEELKNNMIPFKIRRPLPNNKFEIWDLNELDKKHLF